MTRLIPEQTLLFAALFVAGCSQPSPPGASTGDSGTAADGMDDGATGPDDDGATAADDAPTGPGATGPDDGSDMADSGTAADLSGYFPLVDGATWTYRRTSATGEISQEIELMVASEWDGMPAFELRDNEAANGEVSVSFLQQLGTSVLRVHKDITVLDMLDSRVDYDPGFVRFNYEWTDQQVEMAGYTRTETDAMGMLTSEEDRLMTYTVESLSTEVTVPAGTFDCVQVMRVRMDTMETKRFWFAEGVGKVKNETLDTGSTEELMEFSIP